MREIKYKAHNNKTGEILEFCLSDVFTDKYGMFVLENREDWVFYEFTGLKDKNGKEIFEGDIVLVKEVRICEVIFHKEAGCWDLKLRNCISSESIGPVSPASYKYHTEVIGNIYENKDLIEG